MTFASSLNQRVQLQTIGTTKDAAGEVIKDWTPFAGRWASVLSVTGMQAIKAGAEVAITKKSFRLRYCADLTTEMRLVHNGQAYRIDAVLPDDRFHRHVDLVCEAVK